LFISGKNCAIIYKNILSFERKVSVNQEIFDFVCQYLQSTGVPCQKINPPFFHLGYYDMGLRSCVLGLSMDQNTPDYSNQIPENTVYHLTDSFFCCYCILPLPQNSDCEKAFLLCGPYLKTELTTEDLELLCKQFFLPNTLLPQLSDYYCALACFPHNDCVQTCINQLGNLLFGQDRLSILYHKTDFHDIWEEYSNSYRFQVPEDPALSMHMIEKRYELENRLLEAVRRGNSAEAIQLVNGYPLHRFPNRLPDQLRDMKDRLITLNSLLRKEAERGGVHPWHLDQISGNIVVQIEHLQNLDEDSTACKIIRTYCNLVHKYSRLGCSPATQEILLRIDTGLNKDLTLSALAADLKFNPSYLSTLFKNDMGISLTDYVNQKRIEFAKKLLRENSCPIQEIGEQAGFSDPHYFNRLFKRLCGMTPREYRIQYTDKKSGK